MELIRNSWNKNEYKEFINYLFEMRDINYQKFHSGLVCSSNVIGIRTPILKNIAKKIYNGNYKQFLELLGEDYYEEVTLYGLIICNIKNLTEANSYLEKYKSRINNWASCDLFCSGFKIVKKNKEFYFDYINSNIGSDNLWIRRMCFVLLLSYYVEDEYLDKIFMLCDRYCNSEYYVQMAVAWLISICYVNYPKVTVSYIRDNKLDNFTHNKAISKIRDSYRVANVNKEYLNSLRRK